MNREPDLEDRLRGLSSPPVRWSDLRAGAKPWPKVFRSRRRRLTVFVLVTFGLTAVIILFALFFAAGCGGPVYEYRTTVKRPDGSCTGYSSNSPPIVKDGYVHLPGGAVPAEWVTWKQVQIGPHECTCGTILRTYLDECPKCGVRILLGTRTPPGEKDTANEAGN